MLKCTPLALMLALLVAPHTSPAESKDFKEARSRLSGMTYPKNLKGEVFATSQYTTNPSALAFDSKGRMFVCEIHRWRKGVDDIRQRKSMLLEDIMIQSSADRLKMFQNHLDEYPMSWYTNVSEVIKLLEDSDGDGRADKATVYAEHFRDPLDGPGIGVIERDGKVYYTCIPHLWVLEDTDGDDHADIRTSIQDGFGIRMSFSGHDMHGLLWGPDGKLYWSIGDRGYSIKTKEGLSFHGPNEGAVFRCNPDGSDVEVFYHRLRNPQELTIDDYGNIFTADNDGDMSDLERINYIVEGGDSGWHAGHQALMSFTRDYNMRSYKYTGAQGLYNAWEHEYMWKVENPLQPAFILPGIGQINGGPSGFCFNPGNSMGKEYDDKFFVIHYRGSPSASHLTTFDIVAHGAGFKTENHTEFIRGLNAVDVDFGPDGRLYISEYNYSGWENQDVGNIYAFSIPEELAKKEVKENFSILTSNFESKDVVELAALLSRDHRDIRYRAQFELAKRGNQGVKAFTRAAAPDSPLFARLHGVWGLGMMANAEPALLEQVASLAKDEEPHVRTQVMRVLGDHRHKASADILVEGLKDSHAQAAMYAAIGLGRIGYEPAVPALIDLARKNNDDDLFLRHGVVMGLYGLANKESWMQYASDDSPAVRMAVLLTLRMHRDPRIARYLQDPEQALMYEAVRAINDLPIEAATEQLAAHLENLPLDIQNKDKKVTRVAEMMHHRAINANWYGGSMEDAERLIRYTANASVPERQRREALAAIEAWQDDEPLDTTTGRPRAHATDRPDLTALIQKELPGILKSSDGQLLANALRMVGKYKVEIPVEVLLKKASDASNPAMVRLAALKSATEVSPDKAESLALTLLNDTSPVVGAGALEILLKLNQTQGVDEALTMAENSDQHRRQEAIRMLGEHSKDERAKAYLLSQLDALKTGNVDPLYQLDVLEASRHAEEEEVNKAAQEYDAYLNTQPPTVKYAAALKGGNKERGQDTFLNNGSAQCIRCHRYKWRGAKVGPDLTDAGTKGDREYLLRAMVDPGADVAKGFGMIALTMKDGSSQAGIIQGEDKASLTLVSMDGTKMVLQKSDILERSKPVSGMPPVAFLLTPMEIRDLVEFLHHSTSPPVRKDTH